MGQMLTAKQVAEVKGCSYQYVQRIIKEGKLQAQEMIAFFQTENRGKMAMRFFTGNEHPNYLITVGCHGNAISVYHIGVKEKSGQMFFGMCFLKLPAVFIISSDKFPDY